MITSLMNKLHCACYVSAETQNSVLIKDTLVLKKECSQVAEKKERCVLPVLRTL